VENYRKGYALVIGVAEYEDKQIPALRYTTNDAQRLYRALIAQCQFDPNRTYLLTNGKVDAAEAGSAPTRGDVLKRLEYIADSATKDDLVFLFFAGHGAEVSQSPYLITSDTRLDNMKHTAVELVAINDKLSRCQAGCTLRVFDACRTPFAEGRGFAGQMTRGLHDAMLRSAAGWASLSSCSSGESAREADEFKQGVFSYYLCEGLEGKGAADDGSVTLESLVSYIKTSVGNWCSSQSLRQTPHFQADISGVLQLAQSTQAPLADPLPHGHPLAGLCVDLDAHISSSPADARQLSLTNSSEMNIVCDLTCRAVANILEGFQAPGMKVSFLKPGQERSHLEGIAHQQLNHDLNALGIGPLYKGHTAMHVVFASEKLDVPDVDLYIAVWRLSFLYMLWYCTVCKSDTVTDFKPTPEFVKGSFQFNPTTAVNGNKVERAVREMFARSSEPIAGWAKQLRDRISLSIESFRNKKMDIE
jgi:hypothetical protein